MQLVRIGKSFLDLQPNSGLDELSDEFTSLNEQSHGIYEIFLSGNVVPYVRIFWK